MARPCIARDCVRRRTRPQAVGQLRRTHLAPVPTPRREVGAGAFVCDLVPGLGASLFGVLDCRRTQDRVGRSRTSPVDRSVGGLFVSPGGPDTKTATSERSGYENGAECAVRSAHLVLWSSCVGCLSTRKHIGNVLPPIQSVGKHLRRLSACPSRLVGRIHQNLHPSVKIFMCSRPLAAMWRLRRAPLRPLAAMRVAATCPLVS